MTDAAPMLFDELPSLPPDPILGLQQLIDRDPSDVKVDLGIGIYKDDAGAAPVLACVKRAEASLVGQQASKAYFSSAGNPQFNAAMRRLLFGASIDGTDDSRVFTVQTPGGSGALRVAAELLRRGGRTGAIWLPRPSWANHQGIARAAGLEVHEYSYYDAKTHSLNFERMLGDLAPLRPNDVVLLHGCCHNPTGADLDTAQWQTLAELLSRRAAVPLIDLAYQGFAEGLEQDAFGVRVLLQAVPEMLVASSCSKNFALYRDRVGTLSIVTGSAQNTQRAATHLLTTIRTLYSMPPDHGAAVVAHILENATLRDQWLQELADMRLRIKTMRGRFADLLHGSGVGEFSYVKRQSGMFSFLGITPEQVGRLQREFHVYASGSGRINVAGLTHANVEHVANAVAAVLRSPSPIESAAAERTAT